MSSLLPFGYLPYQHVSYKTSTNDDTMAGAMMKAVSLSQVELEMTPKGEKEKQQHKLNPELFSIASQYILIPKTNYNINQRAGMKGCIKLFMVTTALMKAA